MLTQIARFPDDEGLLRVCCDVLLERGDPRGELMALQLKEHRSDDERSREALLIKANVDRWLPPEVLINLDRASIAFERGMFAGARVNVRSLQSLHASLDHPVWATVRWLAAAPAALAARCMNRLESLTDVDERTVLELTLSWLPRLETLGVRAQSMPPLIEATKSPAFERVRELRLSLPMTGERSTPRQFDPANLAGLALKLDRLVLQSGWLDLTPWLERLDPSEPELQITPMVFAATNWSIRFHGRRCVTVFPGSELNASFSEGPVREILSTAPRGFFSRLELSEHFGWPSVRRLPCFERV